MHGGVALLGFGRSRRAPNPQRNELACWPRLVVSTCGGSLKIGVGLRFSGEPVQSWDDAVLEQVSGSKPGAHLGTPLSL